MELPWHATEARSLTVELMAGPIDRVRVEVLAYHGRGGGLDEVQVYRGRELVSAGARTVASASYAEAYGHARTVDGIIASREHARGYWLLPDGQAGWVDILLPR